VTNMHFERFKDDLESRLRKYLRPHTSFRLVEDIRVKFNLKYPDANDPPEHEHPMVAVGIVLLSSAILGTANIEKLVKFTGYSRPFISAIAFNMENNKLWVDGQYGEESTGDGSRLMDLLMTTMNSGRTSALHVARRGSLKPTVTLPWILAKSIGMSSHRKTRRRADATAEYVISATGLTPLVRFVKCGYVP